MTNGPLAEIPRVSIIVPAYEREKFAEQAVASALAQDYPSLEVIFIDDASPEARFENIFSIDDPRFRAYRNKRNLGRTENYRHALTHLATGEWVLVLDGDDYLTNGAFISSAVEAASGDDEVVIVAGRAITRTPDREFVSETPGHVRMEGMALLAALPSKPLFFMHMAALYRRAPAIALDFYRSPHLSSDWESLYRLCAHGKVQFIDCISGIWRIHGENASGSSTGCERASNLSIWPSIFDEARAAGMDKRVADLTCRRCIRYIIPGDLPVMFRGSGLAQFRQYLTQAAEIDRTALLQALVTTLAVPRILAGLFGYYLTDQSGQD